VLEYTYILHEAHLKLLPARALAALQEPLNTIHHNLVIHLLGQPTDHNNRHYSFHVPDPHGKPSTVARKLSIINRRHLADTIALEPLGTHFLAEIVRWASVAKDRGGLAREPALGVGDGGTAGHGGEQDLACGEGDADRDWSGGMCSQRLCAKMAAEIKGVLCGEVGEDEGFLLPCEFVELSGDVSGCAEGEGGRRGTTVGILRLAREEIEGRICWAVVIDGGDR
jgi:hypothetical protein